MPQQRKKRASQEDWLSVALEVLEHEGVEGIRVERLAKKLGIAKSGFYWHFEDRRDLLMQLLEYWAHEYTEVITRNPQLLRGAPAKRLRTVMTLILDHDLAKYDLPMRAWASKDEHVASRVRDVYRKRLDFLRQIFIDLGFKGEELEMRTRLFVGYHTWERTMFSSESKAKSRRLIKRRHALLTRK